MTDEQVSLMVHRLMMQLPDGSAMIVLVQVPEGTSLMIHNIGDDDVAACCLRDSADALLTDDGEPSSTAS